MSSIKTVHVVFKTHLDIGFTDLARNVIDTYVNEFIPKAIEIAEELAKENGSERFIWTTGSWLVDLYLKTAPEAQKRKMEEAIQKGLIVWHGLPFTTHTELMDAGLLEYGLSIAQRLDQKYGKKAISAKMTDVPGHTIAMVPLLAKHGIQYLHVGVNMACKKPEVPDVFVWRNSDGSEVIVNYAGSYGDMLEVEGFQDVLYFDHTNDNHGPSTIEEIKDKYRQLALRFPGAEIKASTMDAFAQELLKFKDRLPVICQEIGDSWNHGLATDPQKVSRYRELLRLRDKWLAEDRLQINSTEYENFCENLLLIPEHTWGLDLKNYLPDYNHYTKADFQAARRADAIPKESIPNKFSYFRVFSQNANGEQTSKPKTYTFWESAFAEQREYLVKAIEALSADKRSEAEQAFRLMDELPEVVPGAVELDLCSTHSLGDFQIEFGKDGSIVKAVDLKGKEWADEEHPLGLFSYEEFGLDNYNTWLEQYGVNMRENNFWADSDLSKPGFEYAIPTPQHKLYAPRLKSLQLSRQTDADFVQAHLQMPSHAVDLLGAPAELWVEYRFLRGKSKIEVSLFWTKKDANRLPEALWFSFAPKVENPNLWKLEKFGQMISPLEVVKSGNRNLHGVGKGVFYHGADGIAQIETWDAPLVSPGERRLLRFDNTFPSLSGGMHFNLFNNLWGGNFRMWYEEDARFRFTLTLESF